eukprot:gnl/TRDRNA2_/TRDRNA2_60816_c0_seq1.p1 gnl/TRDRNA2_/TRDRNA2_60816_c0~~gnl/TRDRNA2_/TRDRNA2_60816_c0_seq1.p1  ORF type:complete len:315 (+),score=78.05 gnl/TRDRNA2_/TRDRNA2_60816_c0_seq1:116-1060(+)
MGQQESAVGQVPVTAPEVEVSRTRQDYLHRLGIQKDKKPFHAPVGPPVKQHEAPDRLESAAGAGDGGAEASGEFELNESVMKPSQDDFRVQFLKRLSYEKVWVPTAQRPPKHQTVIIFDWDDTLLCTSYLNLRQDQALPPTIERHLRGIEDEAQKLLELALRLGHTFIITNAMHGWVEYSAAKYVPGLLPVLQNVRVISARGKFEGQFPGDVAKWKVHAFLEVQRQLDSEIITNLISLGDSNFEMDAVHVMGKEFEQAMIKTIKFQEHPSPEELLRQLELVSQKFERIVENARNLKIGLERKWVAPGHPKQPQA